MAWHRRNMAFAAYVTTYSPPCDRLAARLPGGLPAARTLLEVDIQSHRRGAEHYMETIQSAGQCSVANVTAADLIDALEGDVQLEAADPERGDAEEVKCVALVEAAELGALQSGLQEAGHACSGSLVNVPMTTVECSEEHEELNYKVIDRLDEIDDVSSVEHNMAVA